MYVSHNYLNFQNFGYFMFQTSKEQIIKFCDTIEMPIIYIILLLKWKEEFICQKKKSRKWTWRKKNF